MQLPEKYDTPAQGTMLVKEHNLTINGGVKEEMCVGLTTTYFKSVLANHKASFLSLVQNETPQNHLNIFGHLHPPEFCHIINFFKFRVVVT